MLLSVANVQKSFAGEVVLSDVTFRIDQNECLALVGRNGCGKSTLLKIILGEMKPDGGSVQLAKGARLAHLRQETQITPGRTVLEEAQEGLKELFKIQVRMEELEKLLETSDSLEILDEYTMLHEHFVEADGHNLDRSVQTVLKKLGFTEDEFDRPTELLSGGERTRLALAKLLLEEPELLLLDEPTNHLDLEATEFLERWVSRYRGSVLLVSHDRSFLNSTAQRVIEMRNGKVASYPGPFPKYLQLRAEEQDRLAEVAKRQEIQIAKMDEYVRRFMNSQRTAQARGRLKLMNRLIESKVEAPKSERGLKAVIESKGRSGQIVSEFQKATIGFDDLTLIRNLNWTVRYQERWGVIGENGAGKSTLIKALLGKIELKGGIVRLGSGVTAGYFAQDAVEFDLNQSSLDFMVWECDLSPADARHLLGRFLIEGDDVYRPIRTLSGGEKNKLSLAQLAVLQPNVLILDEPTNHLDMDSREALAQILKEYNGSLILVSHDRWLLGETTDHILDVKKSGPVQYPGGYLEYRRWIEEGKLNSANEKSAAKKKPIVSEVKVEQEPELSPRELSKQIGKVVKTVADLELETARLEQSLKDIEQTLSDLPAHADVYELSREHARVQESLAGTLSAWETQSLLLENLNAKQGSTLIPS